MSFEGETRKWGGERCLRISDLHFLAGNNLHPTEFYLIKHSMSAFEALSLVLKHPVTGAGQLLCLFYHGKLRAEVK